MLARRMISALIDVLVIVALYATILGMLPSLYFYGPFIASIISGAVIYYVFGKQNGIGRIVLLLEDSNNNLTALQKIWMYPPTMIFYLQTAIAAIYPFLMIKFGIIGLYLIMLMYISLIFIFFSYILLLVMNKDIWNMKKNNEIIRKNIYF
ncbi:MAG: hypothetical protein ACK5G7_04585 [Erysipelotrichaceae bacterium]